MHSNFDKKPKIGQETVPELDKKVEKLETKKEKKADRNSIVGVTEKELTAEELQEVQKDIIAWFAEFGKLLHEVPEKRAAMPLLAQGPLPRNSNTVKLETLIKKIADEKITVSFFHHTESKHLISEWKDETGYQYMDITKLLAEGAKLSDINLTDEEIKYFLAKIKDFAKSHTAEKYEELERKDRITKPDLVLGEKVAITEFTGDAFQDVNSFLDGHGLQDLDCWKNLNEILFQDKVLSILFIAIVGTHGLRKFNRRNPSFHYSDRAPEDNEIDYNQFFVTPVEHSEALLTCTYRDKSDNRIHEMDVTSEYMEDLYKPVDPSVSAENTFAKEQAQKLMRVIQGEEELMQDEHLQTYLKDLLKTNQKTPDLLARFEHVEDTKNVPDYIKRRIEAYDSKATYSECRFFSSLRLENFGSPASLASLHTTIQKSNVYIFIILEENKESIRCYSKYPGETEILFPPETPFVCLNHRIDKDGKHFFILKESGGIHVKDNLSKRSP